MGIAVRVFLEFFKYSYAVNIFFWEVKCAITEKSYLYFPDKNPNPFSITFLEVVLYICSYREIEQELNLRQRFGNFLVVLIRNSDSSDSSF